MRRLRTRRQNERGFMTIWLLGLCVCLFFIGGISLDLWRGFSERRELASMTDSAAVAGAGQLDLAAFKGDPSTVALDPVESKQRAVAYMQTEAAKNNVTLTDLQVTVTPQNIQVRARTDLHTSLLAILRPGSHFEIETQSAAQPELAG